MIIKAKHPGETDRKKKYYRENPVRVLNIHSYITKAQNYKSIS